MIATLPWTANDTRASREAANRPNKNMRRYRRAKIVATVGPASSSPEMLKKLDPGGRGYIPPELQPRNPRRPRQGPRRHPRAGTRGRPSHRHPSGSPRPQDPGRHHPGRQDRGRGRRNRPLRALGQRWRQELHSPAPPRNLRRRHAGPRSPDRRRPGAGPRDRPRRRLDRSPRHRRRRDLQPQGHQPAQHGSRPVAAHRQGPRRSRLRAGARRRLGGLVLRAEARRPDRSARPDRRPRRPRLEDREAVGPRPDRGHHPPVRRRHGRARRSRRRDPARGSPRPPEGTGPRLPPRGQAGDRRDPDARQHGRSSDADAGRGLRRGDRHLRRRRRRHAFGGIGHGPISRSMRWR